MRTVCKLILEYLCKECKFSKIRTNKVCKQRNKIFCHFRKRNLSTMLKFTCSFQKLTRLVVDSTVLKTQPTICLPFFQTTINILTCRLQLSLEALLSTQIPRLREQQQPDLFFYFKKTPKLTRNLFKCMFGIVVTVVVLWLQFEKNYFYKKYFWLRLI